MLGTRAPIVERLRGGDRRSIGACAAIVNAIRKEPALFEPIFDAIEDRDPVIAMRAADVIEKVSREQPALLQHHKRRILHDLVAIEQHEVRWQVAQFLGRLELNAAERATVFKILHEWLADKSKIVRACALDALAALGRRDRRFHSDIVLILEHATRSESAAVRARARTLLAGMHRTREI